MRLRSCFIGGIIVSLTVPVVTPLSAHAVGRPSRPAYSPALGDVDMEIDRPQEWTSVDDASSVPDAEPEAGDSRSALGAADAAGRVVVEIVADVDLAARVASLGGVVGESFGGVTTARIPAGAIAALEATAGVAVVRRPVDNRRGRVRSAMPEKGSISPNVLVNLAAIDTGGGSGIKVGVIDGFDLTTLNQAVATGNLASIPSNQRFCRENGAPCVFAKYQDRHGVGVAEIIADVAPNAKLYLAEAWTLNDMKLAIDWFKAQGVTVINYSALGVFDGPGDGTGPSAKVIDYAVAKGITWINAAGNAAADPKYQFFAGGYWRGKWSDPDGDRWLNFAGGDESQSAYCGAMVGVRWSDWGASKTDYDVYVSDVNSQTGVNGSRKLLSGRSQASASSQPIEANDFTWLCNNDTKFGPVYDKNGDGFVSLWVQRSTRTSQSPTGDVIEIMVNSGFLEHSNTPGSAGAAFTDTKNPGAITVGARQPSGLAPYSSQGPMNDGRIKPDLVGYACLQTIAFGTSTDCESNKVFNGTSAAAPSIAGAAALVRKKMPLATPPSVHLVLRQLTGWTPAKNAVPNNQYGWGVPQGTAFRTSPAPVKGWYSSISPVRVLDSRVTSGPGAVIRKGPYPAGSIIEVPVSSMITGGETGVTAAVLQVVAVGPTASGYVQVYPENNTFPGATSSMNFAAGQTTSNTVVVPMNPTGPDRIWLYSTSPGQFLVDLVGVFQSSATDTGKGRLTAVTAVNVLNTETCVGVTPCTGALPTAAATYTVDADLAVGVPASDVSDVMVMATARGATSNTFVSVVPTSATLPPSTSTLNLGVGQAASSLAIVPVNAANEFTVYASKGAHVEVTVLGWFNSNTQTLTDEGMFLASIPQRLIDTRLPAGSTKPAAGTDILIPTKFPWAVGSPFVTGRVLVNLAATKPDAAGSLSVLRDAIPGPDEVVVLSAANQTLAGLTMSDVSLTTFAARGTTALHLVADAEGWFIGPVAI